MRATAAARAEENDVVEVDRRGRVAVAAGRGTAAWCVTATRVGFAGARCFAAEPASVCTRAGLGEAGTKAGGWYRSVTATGVVSPCVARSPCRPAAAIAAPSTAR